MSTLQERLGINAISTLSNRLRHLVQAGLVTQERRSTTLLCRAPPNSVAALIEFLRQVTLQSG